MAPQIVAHRGFKRRFPENTLLAFAQAHSAGAAVVELDLQLTHDNHIVVSHDPDTSRVFNRGVDIYSATLAECLPLRTKEPPHESMPTLRALLVWLARSDTAAVRVMLDIKRMNRLEILRVLHDVLANEDVPGVPVSSGASEEEAKQQRLAYWRRRVVLGLWDLEQHQYIVEHALFGDYEKIVISFSLSVILAFLENSDAAPEEHRLRGVSLLHIATWDRKLLADTAALEQAPSFDDAQWGKLKQLSPLKYFLLRYVVVRDVQLYLWTVNASDDLDWAINFPFVKGIVTDNPDVLAQKLEHFMDLGSKPEQLTLTANLVSTGVSTTATPDSLSKKSAIEGPKTEAPEDILPQRVAYFLAKLRQLQRLRPRTLSKKGARRAWIFFVYLAVLAVFRLKLHQVRLFGKWSVGIVLFHISKTVGLI